ncbi:MAG: asparagine synthase (glutamine-hydrolyzing) [Acidobacteriota bacterium]
MCGICGIFQPERGAAGDRARRAVAAMARGLERRGPDDEGLWSDPEGRLHLGFRRLAILDLSDAGRQPMASADGRSILVFNGEIYNYPDLRRELQGRGRTFRSSGDTEVLLAALETWGLGALDRLDGMFALAWYELGERRLTLARDHAGIKPLYLADGPGGGLAFGSQYDLLSLAPWGPSGPPRLDALHLYLRLGHLPPPWGLLAGSRQLEPGGWLRVDGQGRRESGSWWRLPRRSRPDLSVDEGVEELAEVLEGTVEGQRLADVPLGVFLSGGIDSPLVAATARRQTSDQLRAYTVANPGWGQDEGPQARIFAAALGLAHREHVVTDDDVLATVEEVRGAQHEPFGDFSIVPTLMISRFSRREVTVALSGDGGDELFFGYERPVSLLRDGRDFRWPWPLRLALYGAGRYGLGRRRSDVIVFRDPGRYYFEVHSRLRAADLAQIAPGLPGPPEAFDLYRPDPYDGPESLADFSRRVELYGQLQRGLKKVDMASMHHSLEVRVPLLGRRVLDLSTRIDPVADLLAGRRKPVLRRLLARHLGSTPLPERKLGFSIPLADLLRGPLAPLVEGTLLDGPLYPEGVFDRAGVEAWWREHREGRRDHKWGLWALMGLQWWARRMAELRPPAR